VRSVHGNPRPDVKMSEPAGRTGLQRGRDDRGEHEETAVRSFDGVALATVSGTSASRRAEGREAIVAALDARPRLVLPDGAYGIGYRIPGLPASLPTLAGPRADEAVVIGLRPEPPRPGGPSVRDAGCAPVTLRSLGSEGRSRPWEVAEIAFVPPITVDDLRAHRPLSGGRVHVGLAGERQTACGRLPLQGDERRSDAVDCVRCLRSNVVARRHDAQLARHGSLVALVGSLAAGVADRLWLRFAHRDPGTLPALLDSMVGAIVHGASGAPSVDDTMALVRRHRRGASTEVHRWAGTEALARLEVSLPRLVATHPTTLDASMRRQLALMSDLLRPADAADLLVGILEEHGPAPALEPLTLRIARKAGDEASDRVDHWRRIHVIARTLGASPR
jgi:hypothetical protein